MQKKLLYCLLIVLSVFNSCSNEELSPSENTILPKTLKTIYPNSPSENYDTNFIYDGNKIVCITNKNGKRDYEYDGNHIMKETVYSFYKGIETKDSETLFTYENDKLKTATKLVSDKATKYVYHYNDDGSINIETYNLYSDAEKESKKTEKEVITIVDGNIVKSEYNSGDDYDVISIVKYEYDTSKNAFKNIMGLNLLLNQFSLDYETSLSSNNNMKRYYVNNIQGPLSNKIFEPHWLKMEYEYDKKGYPTKKTTYDYTEEIKEVNVYVY
ncbi:hypothetical protein [Flavobacterium sharifuzzamanii]|uniref:hypothetical protein n=1 Tax=Flavobacterium sharifuzzamanii TaxID=2211133 RepID=UPI000DAED037|nr:hypothetical protein [Flavobacterium sharifuzzamanii]KAF2082837.1 hypothetical protein DMA14_01525 [Flavobacterium sharifuzzamanii]